MVCGNYIIAIKNFKLRKIFTQLHNYVASYVNPVKTSTMHHNFSTLNL